MSDLFALFSSYFNISKLIAVTVPGMVVAFALILVLGPIPCGERKDCPFCQASLTPLKADAAAGDAQATSIITGNIGATAAFGASGASGTSGATGTSGITGTTGASGKSTGPQDTYVVESRLRLGDSPATGSTGKSSQPLPSSGSLNTAVKMLDEFYNKAHETSPDLKGRCGQLPLYLAGTPPVVTVSKTDVDSNATKLLQKDQMEEPLSVLLVNLNNCSTEITVAESRIAIEVASNKQLISTYTSDLTSLSQNLISVQQSGERLVQGEIQRTIDKKKKDLADEQVKAVRLANIQAPLDSLLATLKAMLNTVSAPPAAAPAKDNPVVDVFQTIEQNLLKFLLFSMILGQIFDPLQRGAMSFMGPRRNLFAAFNRVYGQFGDGEFRYGDRRLEPWVDNDGKLNLTAIQLKALSTNGPIEATRISDTKGLELRFNSAAAAFVRDANIYDKNYAVGAGYITKAEAAAIEDEYYGQSQITSGLILPLLIMAVCLAIRFICCSKTASAAGNIRHSITIALASITFGAAVGLVAMLLLLFVGSRKYSSVAWAFVQESGETIAGNIGRSVFFGLLFFGLAVLWWLGAWQQCDPAKMLDPHTPYLIMLPCALLVPLWIAGLDRLHKFYSELEARIAGNILRLNTNAEQKLVDLITDPISAGNLKQKLSTSYKNEQEVVHFLDSIEKKDKPTQDS